jgi:hypothetical protein
MNATTTHKERKLQRLVNLVETSTIGESLVEIRMQRSKNTWETDFYIVTPMPTDFGQGFKVERQGEHDTDEVYDVCLHGDHNGGHLCSCRGFGKWGHCKHVDGIAALVAAGKLQPIGQADDAAERQAIVDELLSEAINSPEEEWARIEAACA